MCQKVMLQMSHYHGNTTLCRAERGVLALFQFSFLGLSISREELGTRQFGCIQQFYYLHFQLGCRLVRQLGTLHGVS